MVQWKHWQAKYIEKLWILGSRNIITVLPNYQKKKKIQILPFCIFHAPIKCHDHHKQLQLHGMIGNRQFTSASYWLKYFTKKRPAWKAVFLQNRAYTICKCFFSLSFEQVKILLTSFTSSGMDPYRAYIINNSCNFDALMSKFSKD